MSSKATITLDLHPLGGSGVVHVVTNGRGEFHSVHATEKGAEGAARDAGTSAYGGSHSTESVPVRGVVPTTSDRWSAFADDELSALAEPLDPADSGVSHAQAKLHHEIRAEMDRRGPA